MAPLHFLWKKCSSVPAVIVLGFICCGFFVYLYRNDCNEKMKNREIKHVIETDYQIKRYVETKDNTSFENDNVKSKKDNDLTNALMRISQNHQYTVLVSVVNGGYINLTYNWLCNTRKWDIHRQVLFIVFDKQTEAVLKKDWPEVTSIFVDGMEDTRGFSYGTVGYARIVLKRVKIMMEIIQHEVTMFLFETDSVWFRNPMPYLDSVTKGYDIAVTKMSTLHFGAVGYCICFLYINPTKVMNKFWNKMLLNMSSELERIKSVDPQSGYNRYPAFSMQKVFSDLINQGYANVHFLVLPDELFPDGHRYMKKSTLVGKTHPYWLHNNYIAGNNNKIRRAKDAGHWFIKDDVTCTNL